MKGEGSTGSGFGDSRLNYRYQLVGDGDAILAIAPRLTALLPTGDYTQGRGAGAVGVEAMVPISYMVSDHVVAHANIGIAVVPNSRSGAVRATTRTWTSGGSVIWLARPKLNFLLEAVHLDAEEVSGSSMVVRRTSTAISPGLRWAHDFPSGLQIVPGIAAPLTYEGGAQSRELFLYLSFEHPFTRAP
jgi:hypothetical protein